MELVLISRPRKYSLIVHASVAGADAVESIRLATQLDVYEIPSRCRACSG